MDKIDARKLFRDALNALRGQAMRLRQELGLPWRETRPLVGPNLDAAAGMGPDLASALDA